jgi:Spy/CpxP family protein refolding chaperone
MNKPWKVVLAFLGVFVAGAVFGGFISLRVSRQFGFGGKEGRHESSMDQFVPMILHRYADRLELTPEQLDKIRPIVQSTGEELRRLRRTNFTETIAVAERMHEQVTAILTTEQRTKFEAMKQELQERWKNERARRNVDRSSGGPRRGHGPSSDGGIPPPPPPAQ